MAARPVWLAGILAPLTLIAVLIVAAGPPAVPAPALPRDGAAIAPTDPLLISLPPLRLTLMAATLQEMPPEAGTAGETPPVPLALLPLSHGKPWEATLAKVARSDGTNPLRPDTAYRLTLKGNWSLLALPWLKAGEWRADYRFTTMPSPKPLVSDQPQHPRYGEPIVLRWDMPVANFSYRVSPAVESTSSLDRDDPECTYIVLHRYTPGQTYRIEVDGATGVNGVALQRPYSLSAVMPKSPTPALATKGALRAGEPVAINWDEPILDFSYQIDPPAPTSAALDPSDHHRASLTLSALRQGQEYRLTITAAAAENGATLERSYTFSLTTPPALTVAKRTPGNKAFGVSPTAPVSVVFSEPVADQKAAERAISIKPAIAGHFEWPGASEVRFVPEAAFPNGSDVTVRLAGGPGSIRGQGGGYLEQDETFQYAVRPDKVIDVNLSRQVVTLLEAGKAILTSLTSTGARGDETPTGTYMVQYKLPSTRMRGYTAAGHYYDVPGVPWVLVFFGDYTIHGAYWRRGFGFPQSAGCVSLPVPFAKQAYDWAPLGTQVVVHY